MRFFERTISHKSDAVLIDVSDIITSFGGVEIMVGVKTRNGKLLGDSWATQTIVVEDDFHIKEVFEVFKKYNIPFTMFLGESKEKVEEKLAIINCKLEDLQHG